jgi:lactoylglutathione lyase
VDFYTSLGFEVVGTVNQTRFGSLTMLKLPGDEYVSVELVHDSRKGPVDLGSGFHHLVIQVEQLESLLAALPAGGTATEVNAAAEDPKTSWLTDPDGYQIELVQWPAGHPEGLSEADFPSQA